MAFDSRCYGLASVFCLDEPALDNEVKRNELAQLIQTTIEDWIEYGGHGVGGSSEQRQDARNPAERSSTAPVR